MRYSSFTSRNEILVGLRMQKHVAFGLLMRVGRVHNRGSMLKSSTLTFDLDLMNAISPAFHNPSHLKAWSRTLRYSITKPERMA